MIRMAKMGRPGHVSLVSSVAGFRGLPRPRAYGPTRRPSSTWPKRCTWICTPGHGRERGEPRFVATPLTARNDFTMPALITPEAGGAGHRARLGRGRSSTSTSPGALHPLDEMAAVVTLPVVLSGGAPLYRPVNPRHGNNPLSPARPSTTVCDWFES